MSIEEEIRRIEEEIKNTPYNKATEKHIGRLKAKLARLKEEAKKSGKKGGHGFAIKKAGDASVAIVGPPSVGKSTLLNSLTNARSDVADYAFTTKLPVPGMMEYEGTQIQIIDLPGLLKGKAEKEIISMVRNVDLIIIMVDIYTVDKIEEIEKELREAGIKINEKKPDVIIRKKDRGGFSIQFSKKCRMSEEVAKAILMEYLNNADVVIRDDINEEQLIDAVLGNKVYLPAIRVINKIDIEQVEKSLDAIYISAKFGHGLEELKRIIFEKLELIRVYMKPEKKKIEEKPMVMKKGATVRDVCEKLHRDFVKNFQYAIVRGKSVSFNGQRVGLNHELADGDILTIITR
ncbi:MAG: 50S ribosome-binding GTPase [Thermoplasmatales archaeon]|nr:50S ribosome-binding GTPase [Thermoplasmatales archaeon]